VSVYAAAAAQGLGKIGVRKGGFWAFLARDPPPTEVVTKIRGVAPSLFEYPPVSDALRASLSASGDCRKYPFWAKIDPKARFSAFWAILVQKGLPVNTF